MGKSKSKQNMLLFNARASTAWSKDESKFGQRMLEKMGWKKGQGLGAHNQGITDNLKVHLKLDAKGLGFKIRDDQWLETERSFATVLSKLKEDADISHGKSTPNGSRSLESKSLTSKSRVHYHKFTRGKDVSRYKAVDLAGILGQCADQEIEDNGELERDDFECNDENVMVDIQSAPPKRKNRKRTLSESNEVAESEHIVEVAESVTSKRKSRKKTRDEFEQDAESDHIVEITESVPSKRKSRKKTHDETKQDTESSSSETIKFILPGGKSRKKTDREFKKDTESECIVDIVQPVLAERKSLRKKNCESEQDSKSDHLETIEFIPPKGKSRKKTEGVSQVETESEPKQKSQRKISGEFKEDAKSELVVETVLPEHKIRKKSKKDTATVPMLEKTRLSKKVHDSIVDICGSENCDTKYSLENYITAEDNSSTSFETSLINDHSAISAYRKPTKAERIIKKNRLLKKLQHGDTSHHFIGSNLAEIDGYGNRNPKLTESVTSSRGSSALEILHDLEKSRVEDCALVHAGRKTIKAEPIGETTESIRVEDCAVFPAGRKTIKAEPIVETTETVLPKKKSRKKKDAEPECVEKTIETAAPKRKSRRKTEDESKEVAKSERNTGENPLAETKLFENTDADSNIEIIRDSKTSESTNTSVLDSLSTDLKTSEIENIVPYPMGRKLTKAERIVEKHRLLKKLQFGSTSHEFAGSNLTDICGYGNCDTK